MPQTKFSWPSAITAFAVSSVFVVWLVRVYVHAEHPAYQWDYSAYWENFQFLGEMIRAGGHWVHELAATVRNQDYNAFGVIPLYPFYWMFGGGRVVYIEAIALTYFLPVVTIAALISVAVAGFGGGVGTLTAFLMAFLFVPFWHPTFRGYIDISGLIFLGLAVVMVIKTDFLQRKTLITALALGVIIWMPFLLRRWYAFAVVSFFVVTFMFAAPFWWRRGGPRGVLTIAASLALSGVIAGALVFLFQKGLLFRILHTSYSEAYAAYQVPFAVHLQMAFDRFGAYGSALIAVGIVAAVVQRNILALYCLVLTVITFLLFTRTQAMAEHHFLPIAFLLFPVYFLGAVQIIRVMAVGPIGVRSAALVVAGSAIFYVSVVPGAGRLSALAAVGPNNISPLHLDNYDQYQKMLGYLKENMGKDDRFSVISTRNGLSDSLLVNLDQNLKSHINYAQQIDTAGLFSTEILRSKFLVVADGGPSGVQASQKVMTVPTEMLLSGERQGFAAAFDEVGRYDLTKGIVGHVFERTRYPTLDEVRRTIDLVSSSDESWHKKHLASMDASFGARIQTLGDTYGMVLPADAFSLIAHPGNSSPTTVTLTIGGQGGDKPKSIRIAVDASAKAACPDADGVGASVRDARGDKLWDGGVEPGQSADVDLSSVDGDITISIDHGQRIGCDSTSLSFLY